MNESFRQLLARRSVLHAIGTGLAGAGIAFGGPATGTGSSSMFNVSDFGAFPDGKKLSTDAFARAVKACSERGGGTVYVPPGEYLSGPVVLASNITLHLEAGAIVRGSPDLNAYQSEGEHASGESVRTGLVTARDADNVTIAGRGVIDGSSMAFHDPNKLHAGSDYDSKYTRQKSDFRNPKYGTEHGPLAHNERPGNLVRFINCRNVLVTGVTIQNSPTWTLLVHRCDGVDISGVYINSVASGRRIPNDDGMDLRQSRNVRVNGCNIDVGDDCVALFGSSNVVVSNCTLASRSAGIRVGFAEGDIRDCIFQNLTINSNCGLKVNVRTESSVENVLFSDVVMRTRLFTGHWWGKGEPVNVSAIRMNKEGGLGKIRNVQFRNILAESEAGILLHGSEESPLENIRFDNVQIGIHNSELQPHYGGNFDLRSALDLSKALYEHDIPGPYLRHGSGVHIRGLRLVWGDSLPDFFSGGIEAEDFRDLEIDGYEGRQAHAGPQGAAISLRNGRGVSIRNCRPTEGTATFLSMRNVAGQRLFVSNDLAAAREAIEPAANEFVASSNVMPAGGM